MLVTPCCGSDDWGECRSCDLQPHGESTESEYIVCGKCGKRFDESDLDEDRREMLLDDVTAAACLVAEYDAPRRQFRKDHELSLAWRKLHTAITEAKAGGVTEDDIEDARQDGFREGGYSG